MLVTITKSSIIKESDNINITYPAPHSVTILSGLGPEGPPGPPGTGAQELIPRLEALENSDPNTLFRDLPTLP